MMKILYGLSDISNISPIITRDFLSHTKKEASASCYNRLMTNLTTVYDNIIIKIPAQADKIPSLSTFLALSVHASFVINLNHIRTNSTNKSTIIANQRYLLTN